MTGQCLNYLFGHDVRLYGNEQKNELFIIHLDKNNNLVPEIRRFWCGAISVYHRKGVVFRSIDFNSTVNPFVYLLIDKW